MNRQHLDKPAWFGNITEYKTHVEQKKINPWMPCFCYIVQYFCLEGQHGLFKVLSIDVSQVRC